jgi:dipeptidyl-peptidase III
MYMQLGVDALCELRKYNIDNQKWGQAHGRVCTTLTQTYSNWLINSSKAHFAMFKCLLRDGNGFMKIDFDPAYQRLTVRVDRSRMVNDGKPALGRMLLKLHMFRCTVDVHAFRAYYEDLSSVDGVYTVEGGGNGSVAAETDLRVVKHFSEGRRSGFERVPCNEGGDCAELG